MEGFPLPVVKGLTLTGPILELQEVGSQAVTFKKCKFK